MSLITGLVCFLPNQISKRLIMIKPETIIIILSNCQTFMQVNYYHILESQKNLLMSLNDSHKNYYVV